MEKETIIYSRAFRHSIFGIKKFSVFNQLDNSKNLSNFLISKKDIIQETYESPRSSGKMSLIRLREAIILIHKVNIRPAKEYGEDYFWAGIAPEFCYNIRYAENSTWSSQKGSSLVKVMKEIHYVTLKTHSSQNRFIKHFTVKVQQRIKDKIKAIKDWWEGITHQLPFPLEEGVVRHKYQPLTEEELTTYNQEFPLGEAPPDSIFDKPFEVEYNDSLAIADEEWKSNGFW